MPTTRPRHYVTETDELAAALDAAAARWPGLSRAQLLVRLALTAADDEVRATQELRDHRLAALDRLASGDFAYPEGYLAELREDWPE
jgi:uncharacterized protein YfiM (DUF2279 family)